MKKKIRKVSIKKNNKIKELKLTNPKYYTKAKELEKSSVKWKKIDDWTYDIYVNDVKVGKANRKLNSKWTADSEFQENSNDVVFQKKEFFSSHEAGRFLADVWIKREKRRILKEIENERQEKKKKQQFDLDLDLDWDKWVENFKF